MPDTNVLQLATVVVLLIVLLVLVVLTQTMSRIEKALKSGIGPPAERGPGSEPEPALSEAQPEAALSEAQPEPALSKAQPEPITTKKRSRRSFRRRREEEHRQPEIGAEAPAVTGAAGSAAVMEAQAEPEPEAAAVGSQVTESAEPAVQSHPLETAAEEEQAVLAATSGAAPAEPLSDLPQEEPFERDGRWWFVRGEELLVYEEGTGQWVPGDPAVLGIGATPEAAAAAQPEGAGPGSQGVTSEMPAAGGGYQLDEPGAGVAGTDEPQAEPQGGFWKCPSCGAVNGSASPTCRMCFAPRP